ncbi:YolD-like family protein [Staphylococcus ureilyticus]|nr:YolD-like family protein [Staphylococcus ureilyticus]
MAEISYWENGYISALNCYIQKLDTLESIMLIKRVDNQSIVRLSLNNIVSVH